jgi:hypothetical protein
VNALDEVLAELAAIRAVIVSAFRERVRAVQV